MRTLTAAIAIVLGCGPHVTVTPMLPIVVSIPSQPARPPTPARTPAPPSGPRTLELESFAAVELASSDLPGFAIGTVRTRRTLRAGPGLAVRAAFDVPRRIVIESHAGGSKRWQLVDPMEDRVIADVAEPDYFYRLSSTEMVVRHGARGEGREAVVDIRTGAELAPKPVLPIAAPIERVYILHAQRELSDVFVMAVAGGRTFVGPWNDRAPSPVLPHEITTMGGWDTYRRHEGLELANPMGKSCQALWLHRARAPECLARDPFPNRQVAITGSWELAIERGSARSLFVATDTATGREERVDLPCPDASFAVSAPGRPRAVMTCYPERDASDDRFVIASWSPGTARVFRETQVSRAGMTGGADARLISIASMHHHLPIGDRWLDLEAGVVLHGPPLQDVNTNNGSFGIAGTGMARRAVVIDADRHTVRSIAALPCPGELHVESPAPELAVVTCGIRESPGTYRFAFRWAKVLDLRHDKIYDLPGYAEQVFADRTVIVSDRTQYAAELFIRSGRLRVVTLD
ncbi:MAG: hypothetical protein ABI867_38400 [Kofleriaceae bacterium]